ncbi:double zinc ribbon and ankyrin repeat-containing protein 1-like isoform X2 [Tubulanus polymorphus]|uniref:double zinc ribbon and ankyrin repeat-containing protein 1-like isoform X2 n=1 Tax=Tubulanus polymorphus TaxID=672921 RepID=UPI003DA52310
MTAGAVSVPVIVPLRAPRPGKPKTSIDTQTKIEITSDTPGAQIHFTINGSKPDPFQPLGSERYTLKYREPIILPHGRVTVKAIAVSKDGVRESHVVSKTFDVEYIEPENISNGNDDDKGFQEEMDGYTFDSRKHAKSLMKKLLKSNQAWADLNKTATKNGVKGSNYRPPQEKARFLDSRLGSISHKATFGDSRVDDMSHIHAEDVDPYSRSENKRCPPSDATQVLRLQRETDFLKCIYCFSPRPQDPYARFCNVCGNPVPPLPQTKIAPPEPGQVGMCVFCKSVVPFNVTTCLVCESPIPPQNQPQASIRLKDHLVCVVCGTGNPSNLNTCVTCECKLPVQTTQLHAGSSAPPLPNTTDRLICCNKCKRVNNPDARFCDWCGAKPAVVMRNLVCSKCTANNQPYAQFCGSCGIKLEPPRREDMRNSGVSLNISDTKSTQPQWLPVSLPTPNELYKARVDVQTQTVGLFFKSDKELSHQIMEEQEKIAYEKLMRDRKPLMTAVSPGRGYWRKQMDHICTHLRAHTQNDAQFRALIGEPRMGKLINTMVQEDGYELSLTINFALRGNKDPLTGKPFNISKGEFLSTVTNRRASIDSFRSESTVASYTSGKRRTRKKKKPVKKEDDDETKMNKALIKEVGKNGEGRIDEVQRLIDEGADAKVAVTKENIPVLIYAVMNKHIDAVPVLVQNGSDVNEKSPFRGNTALHEAVSLGPVGAKIIDNLLQCGANQKKKNDRGETAYDLAVKSGYEDLIKKFTSSLGQTQLDKMMRPKTAEVDDDF